MQWRVDVLPDGDDLEVVGRISLPGDAPEASSAYDG